MTKTAEKTAEPTLALEGAVNDPAKPMGRGKALAAPKGQPVERAPAGAVTPMEMLSRAVNNGASIEVLEKLMALSERWESNQARKAFDNAMSAAKSEIPIVNKNKTVDFTSAKGRTNYRYEDLAEVARTVSPILAKHGLSYRFRATSALNEPITVTCIVSHRDGHFEEITLSGGRDESGNKNSIQAVGSTLTYLQRMTLKAALGLAASDDDDGRAAGKIKEFDDSPKITEEQVIHFHDKCEAVGCPRPRFLAHIKADRFEDIPAADFERHMALLSTFKAK